MLDVWLLLYFFFHPHLYNKTNIQSVYTAINNRCNLCIYVKNSIFNLKDCRQLLNELNELVFKCGHKSKFRLSWLGITKASALDNSRDIDAGWFLLEIITFISVVNSIIWRGDLCKGEDSLKFRYWFKNRAVIWWDGEYNNILHQNKFIMTV